MFTYIYIKNVYCKISLMRKTDKNVIKICYRKRKCASSSGGRTPRPPTGAPPMDPAGDFRPQTPSITCAVQKFPLKSPGSNNVEIRGVSRNFFVGRGIIKILWEVENSNTHV